jgi:hypothetical protein
MDPSRVRVKFSIGPFYLPPSRQAWVAYGHFFSRGPRGDRNRPSSSRLDRNEPKTGVAVGTVDPNDVGLISVLRIALIQYL